VRTCAALALLTLNPVNTAPVPNAKARNRVTAEQTWKNGEFGVCSGVAPAFEGGVRQFRGCKTMNSIGAFSESRLPGT
jgi:hypothetical protein